MRVKEAPASALRAVFGGIGSLLGVTDKVRAKPAAPEATVSTETAPPETTTPETVAPVAAATETAPATEAAAPEAEAAVAEVDVVEVDVIEVDGDVVEVDVVEVYVVEAVEPEVVAPEPVVAETAVVEPVVTETVVVETAAPETAVAEDTAALPLANYDDLSVASLRARLRNLSADQLGTLIEYEKSHAARADVISMFERRIVKLATESYTAHPRDMGVSQVPVPAGRTLLRWRCLPSGPTRRDIGGYGGRQGGSGGSPLCGKSVHPGEYSHGP